MLSESTKVVLRPLRKMKLDSSERRPMSYPMGLASENKNVFARVAELVRRAGLKIQCP